MRTFFVIWLGQLVSVTGSSLSSFALAVWILQTTGSTTSYAGIFLSASLPGILFSPIAGALVDRWDRRRVMLVSDAVAALGTLALFLLLFAGRLEPWQIYVTSAINALCASFQNPAYIAAITVLVPKSQYGRASGMVQMASAVAEVLAPALAGVLLVAIGARGVLAIDLATAAFAITTLAVVRIPSPARSAEGAAARGTLWQEAAFGWRYIVARKGLLRLVLLFSVVNFATGMVIVLFTPLVLSLHGPEVTGVVLTLASSGMLLGAALMSAWGGPERRVQAIVAFVCIQGATCLLAGFQPNVVLIVTAAFIFLFTVPVINACTQTIWQRKVAPDVQGRVFAVRRMIARIATPLAYLLAGPLADDIFEPMLADGGALASTVGRVIGVGPGRGIAFLYVMLGVLIISAAVWTSLSPRFRRIESELPDAVPDRAKAAA